MGAKRGRPKPVRSGRKKGTKNGQYTRNKVENPIRTTYEAGVEEGRKLKVGVTPVPKEYVAKDRLLHRIAWVNVAADDKLGIKAVAAAAAVPMWNYSCALAYCLRQLES